MLPDDLDGQTEDIDAGDGAEDIDAGDGGGGDGSENENMQDASDNISKQAGSGRANKKPEGEEGQEGDGEAEGEISESGVDYAAEYEKLRKEFDEFKNGANAAPKQQPAAAQQDWSPEQWKDFEDRTGVSKSHAMFTSTLVANAVNKAMEAINARFGDLAMNDHVVEMSRDPRFKDAGSYKNDILDFLKNQPVDKRSNPQIREMAYFYAKGKASGKTMRRVISGKESNKKVIVQQSARPSGAKTKIGVSSKLSDAERHAMKSSGMNEAEYVKFKTKPIEELLA